MRYSNFILLGLLAAGTCSPVFAQDPVNESAPTSSATDTVQASKVETKHPTIQAIKDLKHLTKNDLKVNANAAQPDTVKDPLQPLNRQIFAFNDTLDHYILKPVAIQYVRTVPAEVRSPYRQFRKNLGEPWNAVNQLIQGRPARAAKTLGRFTINTLTTLGIADPARRLGLNAEDESFGVTLGYYGISSGPYVMLPFFGPSTFRDGFGLAVDSFGRPQKYLLDDQEGVYWSTNVLQAIDARSQILDIEESLKGDKYAMIRDFYLQRKAFQIAEKRGDANDISFVGDDDADDSSTDEQ